MNSLLRSSLRRRCCAKRPTKNGAKNRRLRFMSSVACETPPLPSHEYVTKSFAQSLRSKQWPLSTLENPWATRPDAPQLIADLGEFHEDVSELRLVDAVTDDVPRQVEDQQISPSTDESLLPDADHTSQQPGSPESVPPQRQADEKQKNDPLPVPRAGGIAPNYPTNFQGHSRATLAPEAEGSNRDQSVAKSLLFGNPIESSKKVTAGSPNHLFPKPRTELPTAKPSTELPKPKPSTELRAPFSKKETTESPNHLVPVPKLSTELPTAIPSTELSIQTPSTELRAPKPSTELPTHHTLTSNAAPTASESTNTAQSCFVADGAVRETTIPPKSNSELPTHSLTPDSEQTASQSTSTAQPWFVTDETVRNSSELPTHTGNSDSEPTASVSTSTAQPWFVTDGSVSETTLPPVRPSLYAEPPSTKPSVRSIYQYMHKEDQEQAMRVYRECRANDVRVHAQTVKALFRLSAPHKTFDMYELLKHYRSIEDTAEYRSGDGDINGYVNFYERLCYSTGFLDPTTGPIKLAEVLVHSLVNEIRTLDRDGREKCYPTFVSAMVGQKWVALGPYAGEFYECILREELKPPEGWYTHILSCSRFNRQRDIDFADIMRRSVEAGVKPDANVTIRALNNLYPFDDTEGVGMFLESILKLRASSTESNAYAIDIHTLELIGAAAARQGNSDVNLLIWDVLDGQGATPTEGMYENTTTAFACNPFTYKEAFTVLYEMENNGFQPSRAFIRTLSTQLRKSGKNLGFAIEQLRLLAFDGKRLSVSALKVLLSAAAERGEVHRTLDLYALFDQNRLKPDVDTFSYVFESLGKLIRWRRGASMKMSPKQIDGFLVTAETFIQRMEDHGIEPSHHVIRDYVEFLCHVDQVETANSVVFGAADEPNLISSKTVYCVVMANLRAQKFDVAREIVATFAKANFNPLMRRIGQMESQRTAEEVPEP